MPVVVIKDRLNRDWKQITTVNNDHSLATLLLSKIVWTEIESKSQLQNAARVSRGSCYQRSFEQRLKANHNIMLVGVFTFPVVIKDRLNRDWKQITTNILTNGRIKKLLSKIVWTEIESKSQRYAWTRYRTDRCYQRSFEQRLKANHNSKMLQE